MSKVTIETGGEIETETAPETIDVTGTEIVAMEAAQAAVVAAESAIQLANTQSAIVNAEAAETVAEALSEIKEEKEIQEWHGNQLANLSERMTTMEIQLTKLAELMQAPVSSIPPILPEAETNLIANSNEMQMEPSSVTQTEAPENVEVESPAEILAEIADKAKRRIRLI